jgi:hypothetical protein
MIQVKGTHIVVIGAARSGIAVRDSATKIGAIKAFIDFLPKTTYSE